jgi:CRP-like cAMP-binding protein
MTTEKNVTEPDAILQLFRNNGANHRQLQTGDNLFREGDRSPGLCLITDGMIDMVRWTGRGRRVLIHRARAVETFAEASLFSDACHCDAVATVPSELLIIPRAEALALMNSDREAALLVIRHLSGALRDARRLVEIKSVNPLPERLLMYLEEHADPEGNLPIDLRFNAIADTLGASPEAVSRALGTLQKAGKVSRPERGVVRLTF